jgi:hypothetical protein
MRTSLAAWPRTATLKLATLVAESIAGVAICIALAHMIGFKLKSRWVSSPRRRIGEWGARLGDDPHRTPA